MNWNEAEKAAQTYIVWLLSKREYSKKQILEKLRTRFPDEKLAHVAHFCEEKGWISDERFCECYIRDKAIIAGWGKQKIQFQIFNKGIDSELFEKLFLEVVEAEEILATLKKLAQDKWKVLRVRAQRKEWNFWETKQKLTAYLAGRGYEFDLIKQVLPEICKEGEF